MTGKKKKPYLGPILLTWCDHCNIPIAKGKNCSCCGGTTRSVSIAPPGDARPAFEGDLERLYTSISKQYDERIAEQLIPSNKIVLLNSIPDIDCCEEVILDGQIIGLHRFRIDTLSWEFIPKMEGARRLVELTTKNQVVIYDSAVEYIVRGANVLRPGIKTADPTIDKGDSVIVVDEKGFAVLVGSATMPGDEMQKKGKGMAVRKRYKAQPTKPRILLGGQTWEQVIHANKNILRQIEKEAIDFILDTRTRIDRPVSVAFSGGKDSLAVLILVQKALQKEDFHIMFINTGIEFPETVQNVHSTVATLGLEKQLIVKHVEKDQFFRVLDQYGFVARDFRVCCKTVKLGPTTQLIEENFPTGCLSFIGQRRYESIRRSRGRRIWQNPWVPNQIGASPIHNWTALMVWLYLFQENAPFNDLYRMGFERIGCMFCPASTLSEFETIAMQNPQEWRRWTITAERIAKRDGFSERWVKYGFWRWRNPPPKLRDMAERLNIPLKLPETNEKTFSFTIKSSVDSSATETRIEGQFSSPIAFEYAQTFLPILGEVVVDSDRNIIEVIIIDKTKRYRVLLFKSGHFTISGPKRRIEKIKGHFIKAIVRGVLCTGCGTCQSLCDQDAIVLKSGRALVLREKCSQCGKCLRGKCPSLYALQV